MWIGGVIALPLSATHTTLQDSSCMCTQTMVLGLDCVIVEWHGYGKFTYWLVVRRARTGHLFLIIPHPCLFLPSLTKQLGQFWLTCCGSFVV